MDAEETTDINISPLIDMVFILLIFFMLASNFNKLGEINMNLTKESSNSSQTEIKILKLMVHQDQTIMSEGKTYKDKEILNMIQIAIKDASEYAIILTSKDDVRYQRFLNVMSFLKLNKIDNVKIGIKNNETKN